MVPRTCVRPWYAALVVLAFVALALGAQPGGGAPDAEGGPQRRHVRTSALVEEFAQRAIHAIVEKLDLSDTFAAAQKEAEQGHAGRGCDLCKDVAWAVQQFLLANATEAKMGDWFTDLCLHIQVGPPVVCRGLIDEYRSMFLGGLIHRLVEPSAVCSLVGLCPHAAQPALRPLQFPKPKPSPSEIARRFPHTLYNSTGEHRIRLVHITDAHIDYGYQEGANANCGPAPLLCCRKNNPAPLQPTQFRAAGTWGDYNCDFAPDMYESMLEFIRTSPETAPDMVIFGGDITSHNDWNETQAVKLATARHFYGTLAKYFPSTPVVPVIGNHEGMPIDSFPLPPRLNWLFGGLSDQFSAWLPPDALREFQYAGFYTMMWQNRLRVITINNNYWNNLNMWILVNATDPAGQFQWLIHTLQEAEDSGTPVLFLGHIPPGDSDGIISCSEKLYSIITRYSHVIVAQLYGHTHHDEFEVFYDVEKEPVSVALVSPSMTTYTDLNPEFRVLELDAQTFELLDVRNYLANISEANARGAPEWRLAYSAREAYKMKNMSPTAWNGVADRMANDQATLDFFNLARHAFVPHGRSCTGDCKLQSVCKARSASVSRLLDCSRGHWDSGDLMDWIVSSLAEE